MIFRWSLSIHFRGWH